MVGRNITPSSRRRTTKGSGLISTVINKAIDALPIELHLPGGYRYCGPGTRLEERLARGDPGINELDESCKVHDIAYSLHKDNYNRKLADQRLAESAWKRFKSSNASLGEKAAAWAVTTTMKAKSKLGGGNKRGNGLKLKKREVKKRKGKGSYLKPKRGDGLYLKPKRGGALPLVPIFAGLSALGSLVGGVSTAIKAASGKGLRIKHGNGNIKKKRTSLKKKKSQSR